MCRCDGPCLPRAFPQHGAGRSVCRLGLCVRVSSQGRGGFVYPPSSRVRQVHRRPKPLPLFPARPRWCGTCRGSGRSPSRGDLGLCGVSRSPQRSAALRVATRIHPSSSSSSSGRRELDGPPPSRLPCSCSRLSRCWYCCTRFLSSRSSAHGQRAHSGLVHSSPCARQAHTSCCFTHVRTPSICASRCRGCHVAPRRTLISLARSSFFRLSVSACVCGDPCSVCAGIFMHVTRCDVYAPAVIRALTRLRMGSNAYVRHGECSCLQGRLCCLPSVCRPTLRLDAPDFVVCCAWLGVEHAARHAHPARALRWKGHAQLLRYLAHPWAACRPRHSLLDSPVDCHGLYGGHGRQHRSCWRRILDDESHHRRCLCSIVHYELRAYIRHHDSAPLRLRRLIVRPPLSLRIL